MSEKVGPNAGSDAGPSLLFQAPVQSRETDERYTPSWIFEALGERFDLDPASPPLGVSQVPTDSVWTKDDDGLTQPWHGFVWCNPPFSHSTAWSDRFIQHSNGIWLGPVANGGWHDRMTRASDGMVLLRDFAFISPTHAGKRSSMPLSMHGFGTRARNALTRFSARVPEAGVLLLRMRQSPTKRVLMTQPHDGHLPAEECPGCPHTCVTPPGES